MTKDAKQGLRYWGTQAPPKSKAEILNAVTTPAPSGEGTVATIRMYGPIDSWGGWWGVSAEEVGQVLDQLPDTVTEIVLRINSPGGEVFEGLAILNMFRAHKATVTAVVDGRACSAASFIAAGCDETVMSPGTQMMIHSPSVIAWGNSADLRKTADILDGIQTSLIEIYSDKAGEKDWDRLLDEETWLTAKEAVELGLADRVAVIKDAGETATVGEPETVILVPDEDEEADDLTLLRFAADARRPHMPPVSAEPGSTIRKENVVAYDDLKAGIAKRLGVTDADVTDEMLFAALDQTLAEQPETPAAPAATLPDGVVPMDAAALQELRDQAALGAQAREEQISDRRDAIVAKALGEGRITSASRDKWRAALDTNEAEAKGLLETMAANTATPVAELGHADTVTSTDDALYAQAWGSTEKGA